MEPDLYKIQLNIYKLKRDKVTEKSRTILIFNSKVDFRSEQMRNELYTQADYMYLYIYSLLFKLQMRKIWENAFFLSELIKSYE